MKPEKPAQASHVILMRQPRTQGSGPEAQRPLSEAGREAARTAARDMYGAGHHPGPVLASDTVAGRQTAQIIATEVHLGPEDIHFSDDLAGANTDTLEVEVRLLAKEFTLVTLVAFEPGISELARILARDPRVPSLQPGQWRYLPWPPPY